MKMVLKRAAGRRDRRSVKRRIKDIDAATAKVVLTTLRLIPAFFAKRARSAGDHRHDDGRVARMATRPSGTCVCTPHIAPS